MWHSLGKYIRIIKKKSVLSDLLICYKRTYCNYTRINPFYKQVTPPKMQKQIFLYLAEAGAFYQGNKENC